MRKMITLQIIAFTPFTKHDLLYATVLTPSKLRFFDYRQVRQKLELSITLLHTIKFKEVKIPRNKIRKLFRI